MARRKGSKRKRASDVEAESQVADAAPTTPDDADLMPARDRRARNAPPAAAGGDAIPQLPASSEEPAPPLLRARSSSGSDDIIDPAQRQLCRALREALRYVRNAAPPPAAAPAAAPAGAPAPAAAPNLDRAKADVAELFKAKTAEGYKLLAQFFDGRSGVETVEAYLKRNRLLLQHIGGDAARGVAKATLKQARARTMRKSLLSSIRRKITSLEVDASDRTRPEWQATLTAGALEHAQAIHESYTASHDGDPKLLASIVKTFKKLVKESGPMHEAAADNEPEPNEADASL